MQAGTVLDGRYRLIEPVGAGGFGHAWQAHDPKVDRQVAVKVFTGDGGGLSHPRIVTVHDFGSATHHRRPCAYLVMQLLPGKSLSALLEAGPLPLPKALYVASCVADALGAAHEAGLTHRDIKPSNIIVRSTGEATVVNFGITKGSDARHDITTTGVLIGTPAYMAPEALSGSLGHPSDLYSLGCVLFEAVTGRRPFTGAVWHLTAAASASDRGRTPGRSSSPPPTARPPASPPPPDPPRTGPCPPDIPGFSHMEDHEQEAASGSIA